MNFVGKKSFQSIPNWLKEISDKIACDVYLILVGNKCDLKGHRYSKFNYTINIKGGN